jgi:hypothetical protein
MRNDRNEPARARLQLSALDEVTGHEGHAQCNQGVCPLFKGTEAFEHDLLRRFFKRIEQKKRPATTPSRAPQLTLAGYTGCIT